MSAAERMRAYRRRLRERGEKIRSVRSVDPIVKAVRFSSESLLTPAEQDVIRRFCAGLRRLPSLPAEVAVFGSRVKGDSTIGSALDVAVLLECPRAPRVEQMLYSLAHQAQAPYVHGPIGICLKPVAIFQEDRRRGFFGAIRNCMEPVWTRPR